MVPGVKVPPPTQRLRVCMRVCPPPLPTQADLPFAELKAVVDRGRRLMLTDLPDFKHLVQRLATASDWLARAQAAARGVSTATDLRALAAEAATLGVRMPGKDVDALETRASALDAWAAEAARALAPSVSVEVSVLVDLKTSAHRLRSPASATVEAIAQRLAAVGAWRKAATALVAKPGCRKSLAALVRGEGRATDAACAFCAGSDGDPYAPAVATWVACDLCGDWFHTHCMGITEAMGARLERLVCSLCCTETPPTVAYPLGEALPRVLTRRPPLDEVLHQLREAAGLGVAMEETGILEGWVDEAECWEGRCADAVRRLLATGRWTPPKPAPAVACAKGPPSVAASPTSLSGVQTPRKRRRGAEAEAAKDRNALPESAAAAARTMASEALAQRRASILGAILESARPLQVGPPHMEVAAALEACLQGVVALIASD